MASRFIVRRSVAHPMRADASAASHPACPAPITMTSHPLSRRIIARERSIRGLDRQSRGEQYAPMRFGFSLPGRGPLARPDTLVKLAEKADRLRYASVFVTDHVVIPVTYDSTYPYATSGRPAGDWTEG